MNVGKVFDPQARAARIGVVVGDRVMLGPVGLELCELLFGADPVGEAAAIAKDGDDGGAAAQTKWLAPIDRQEVWAAGVTYIRSRQARMDESESAARFYDRVYAAERPELFFKATPNRVSNPGEPVRVRADSRWSVPEPEIALVLTPEMRIVGYTIGNDMSARDIEGENPLYLPQAKVYRQCAALGPTVVLTPTFPEPESLVIRLEILRGGQPAFVGETTFASMKRTPQELVGWLGRENEFPRGAFLLTGTGVVPPEDFALEDGDLVHIDVTGVGRLSNPVAKG
jgi:2-dehydro-3-deoxy-D-arabinonate dehydratase